MRLCLVSHYENVTVVGSAAQRHVQTLCQYTVALAQQGHEVFWLLSQDLAQHCAVPLVATPLESLPPTCRYVVPCQLYRLAGVQACGVDVTVWQHPDLHTRLFTLLCLLHRACSWDLVHAWGDGAAVYLGVYTARFLGLPAVVSYSPAALDPALQQSFIGTWVAQNATRVIVAQAAEHAALLALGAISSDHVQVIDVTLPTAAQAMTALYTSLQAAAVT
jgi:hypothetical protein